MSDSFVVSRASNTSAAGLLRSSVAGGEAPRASTRESIAPQGRQSRSLMSSSTKATLAAGFQMTQVAGAGVEAAAFMSSTISAVLGADGVANAARAAEVSGHVATAAGGIATVASLYTSARNLYDDVKAAPGRSKLDRALVDFDAASHDPSSADFAEARELIDKHGPAVLNGHKDATVARLTDLKRAALTATTTTLGVIEWAGVIAPPGVGIANMAVRTADSLYKVGTGTAAISALRAAVKNSGGHPVLMALAKHAEAQRVTKGRIDLTAAAITGTGAGLQIAATVAGGAAALGIAGAAAGVLAAGAGAVLTGVAIKHQVMLGKQQSAADGAFKTLVPTDADGVRAMYENGSLAELAALDMLRNGSPDDRAAVVSFLKTFGMSDKLIFGLSVMDKADAIGLLRDKLHHDAVDTKAANAGKSALRVFTSRLKSLGQMFYKRSEKSFSLEAALAKLPPAARGGVAPAPAPDRFTLERAVVVDRRSTSASAPPGDEEGDDFTLSVTDGTSMNYGMAEEEDDIRMSVREWISARDDGGRSAVRRTAVRLRPDEQDELLLGGASLRKRTSMRLEAQAARETLPTGRL